MKITTENQNVAIKNTLTSLVLKRLHVHFALGGGHRLKIVDNEINGSETTVCSLYCDLAYCQAKGTSKRYGNKQVEATMSTSCLMNSCLMLPVTIGGHVNAKR